jgi:hypothetical protein
MPELFPDFATDRAAFERAKVFWSKLANEEVSAAAQAGEWTSWFQILAWENNLEMMEGAVVHSLYSASQNKGLRVQHYADRTKDEEPFITSFTDVFGEGHLERPIPNLFIGVIPTDENLPLIRRLIARWFERSVDREAMNAFLEIELYRPYEKRG